MENYISTTNAKHEAKIAILKVQYIRVESMISRSEQTINKLLLAGYFVAASLVVSVSLCIINNL